MIKEAFVTWQSFNSITVECITVNDSAVMCGCFPRSQTKSITHLSEVVQPRLLFHFFLCRISETPKYLLGVLLQYKVILYISWYF